MSTTRRNFLGGLLAAGAGFLILPSATTYARRWVRSTEGVWVLNPDWVNARYEYQPILFDDGRYYWGWCDRIIDFKGTMGFGPFGPVSFSIRSNIPDSTGPIIAPWIKQP